MRDFTKVELDGNMIGLYRNIDEAIAAYNAVERTLAAVGSTGHELVMLDVEQKDGRKTYTEIERKAI